MYTICHSHIQNSSNHKRWIYYQSSHCLSVNVLQNTITFLWFLLFSICESLHTAVKMYINYSFFYIYICSFITAEVCNLCNMHCRTCYFTDMKICNSHQHEFPRINNTFCGMQAAAHVYQLLQDSKISSLKCVSIVTLTFIGHVTSSLTWSFWCGFLYAFH